MSTYLIHPLGIGPLGIGPLGIGVMAITLSLAACGDMSATQQRALSGTAAGAAGGTVIGAIAGNAGMGAAIGAGAGLAGGMIYDYHKKTEEEAYQRGLEEGQH